MHSPTLDRIRNGRRLAGDRSGLYVRGLSLVLGGILVGCSSDTSDKAELVDGVFGSNATPVLLSRPVSASRVLEFSYRMDAVQGGRTKATALLFEPRGVAPERGHPLVVWAHGTTGIANACAPSANPTRFLSLAAIDQLLAAGYAVLAPDYEGFGTDSIHPYYLRDSHANAVIEALPAAHAVATRDLSKDWAIVGHSQGGHVALATARAMQDPTYPLAAVVALAPGTDARAVSDAQFDAIDAALVAGEDQIAAERVLYLNVYGAFVAEAAALVVPDFAPENVFGGTVASLIHIASEEDTCGSYSAAVTDALGTHISNGGSPATFDGVRRDWYNADGLAEHLQYERLEDEAQQSPLLIVQGDADRQIPVAATENFVDSQIALGTDVTYHLIVGGRHRDPLSSEFEHTLTWLETHFPPR